MPLGYVGGVSGEHWFGLEPGLGRDIFIRMVYGMRTSLFIAFAAALITTGIGVVLGILAGYLGGVVDAVISWITDVALAMPFLIFALAVVPTFSLRFYGPRDAIPAWFAVGTLIVVFAAFGWTSTARLVRGQVISLREREFVEAARATGAGLGHMLFRQLLPNIWAPILVSFSLTVPAYITGEAALSLPRRRPARADAELRPDDLPEHLATCRPTRRTCSSPASRSSRWCSPSTSSATRCATRSTRSRPGRGPRWLRFLLKRLLLGGARRSSRSACSPS